MINATSEPNSGVSARGLSIQILIEGAQELLGTDQLFQKMREHPAGKTGQVTFEEAVRLIQDLEERFGVSGGRGLSLRIGRAVFRSGMEHFANSSGLDAVEYRLLPAPRRLDTGLHILSSTVSGMFDDRITVQDAGTAWLWRSDNCPICRDRRSGEPCCYLTVGFLQEFMSWAGGGRYHPVKETECRSVGQEACLYRIAKKPLDD